MWKGGGGGDQKRNRQARGESTGGKKGTNWKSAKTGVRKAEKRTENDVAPSCLKGREKEWNGNARTSSAIQRPPGTGGRKVGQESLRLFGKRGTLVGGRKPRGSITGGGTEVPARLGLERDDKRVLTRGRQRTPCQGEDGGQK